MIDVLYLKLVSQIYYGLKGKDKRQGFRKITPKKQNI